MSDYKKIFRRANIQELRSLFLDGVDIANWCKEPDTDGYGERIKKGEKPLMEFLEGIYPDGEKRDEVFDLVCKAIQTNREVYTEIGMRLGARILFELIQGSL